MYIKMKRKKKIISLQTIKNIEKEIATCEKFLEERNHNPSEVIVMKIYLKSLRKMLK
jgi:hypothetical protein